MGQVRDDLIAARLLIEDPMNWTQNAYARDDEGYTVPPESPLARCWCATGAIWSAVGLNPNGGGSRSEIDRASRALVALSTVEGVAGAAMVLIVNDGRRRGRREIGELAVPGTHPAVMAMFDAAIRSVR